MEGITGRKTIQEMAVDHAIHPIQVSPWKRQLLDGASELFTRGKKKKNTGDSQVKEAELFQQIGKLQMELEWLKNSLSSSDARELRKLVDHDHPELSVSRHAPCWVCPDPRSITGRHRCVNQRCRSWPGSMRSNWRIPAAEVAGWWSTWFEKASRSAAIEHETSCGAWVAGDLPETTHHGSGRLIGAIPLSAGRQASHDSGPDLGDQDQLQPAAEGFPLSGGVVDLLCRNVLSWKLSNNLATQFCLEALGMALEGGRKPEIFHKTRGARSP